jgi:hypothetical protein
VESSTLQTESLTTQMAMVAQLHALNLTLTFQEKFKVTTQKLSLDLNQLLYMVSKPLMEHMLLLEFMDKEAISIKVLKATVFHQQLTKILRQKDLAAKTINGSQEYLAIWSGVLKPLTVSQSLSLV